MPQHRIYLGRPHADGDREASLHHWRHRHSRVVRGMPLIGGYVQNRPVGVDAAAPYLVCVETWFASREDEQRSYASGYYKDIVMVDELNVIPPEGAWNAAVAETDVHRDGPRTTHRVLAFGTEDGDVPPEFSRVEILRLRRPGPEDTAPVILSAWTDALDAAQTLAAGCDGGLAFVSEPHAIVRPELIGWDRPASTDGTDADPESLS